MSIFKEHLTLNSQDAWKSQVRFPYMQVGKPGIYNITADSAVIGIEIRPIPQDDVKLALEKVTSYCQENGLVLDVQAMENGIACDPENPYLKLLVQAARFASLQEPRLGKKLPGSSARFAPGGRAVVWGQTGIGPHSKDERHYIPSILPYYHILENFSRLLLEKP